MINYNSCHSAFIKPAINILNRIHFFAVEFTADLFLVFSKAVFFLLTIYDFLPESNYVFP